MQGERHTATVRREQHQVVRHTGAVEVVQIDTPTTETQYVGALERLKARRRLAVVEDELALAEQVLEEARTAAAVAERATREAVVAEGLAVVRADLPRLLRETRRVQREWQALQARCEALDQRLGMARFAEAARPFVMAPNAQFDGFVRYLRESYGVDLD